MANTIFCSAGSNPYVGSGIAITVANLIELPPVQITVNDDYSLTFTQVFPANFTYCTANYYTCANFLNQALCSSQPLPTVASISINYQNGANAGTFIDLGTFNSPSIVANEWSHTTDTCLLPDEAQYSANLAVTFVQNAPNGLEYLATTAYSTTFWRTPGLTYQGPYGVISGTAVPYDTNTGCVLVAPRKKKRFRPQ